ncbi:hypothetical protein [Halarsenatibacter silvermanii]|uniref:Uncharacterized protein n=1 Tax=Halarsenatibacter silvermanii TaxID=321763 RepID=A0A1G9HUW9_9FIRM|nr:hypothetical protein [Halarsenatibacter silvermanii]SDL16363.1 hypothetical protein SAMN04488692_10231 [Halarsenatibacter silvermanii]
MEIFTKVVKYALFSLVLAVIAGGVMLGAVYLQSTAVEIERPERRISPEGAHGDTGELARRLAEETPEIHYRDMLEAYRSQSGARLQGTAANFEKFGADRQDVMERGQERRLAGLEHRLEREFENYSQERLAEAEAEIAAREREMEQEIEELQREIRDREIGMLDEVRQEAREEYRTELLSLNVKLRAMDLSEERREELESRLEEIETDISSQVEQVEAQLESRMQQEQLRRSGRKIQEFNSFRRFTLARAETDIENRRRDKVERLEKVSGELAAELEAEINRLEEYFTHQLEQLEEHYQNIYGIQLQAEGEQR